MIWAPDLDDFSGRFCNQGTYPLMKTVVNLVRTGVIVPVVIPTTPLTTASTSTTRTTPTATAFPRPTTSTAAQPTPPPSLSSTSEGKHISFLGIFFLNSSFLVTRPSVVCMTTVNPFVFQTIDVKLCTHLILVQTDVNTDVFQSTLSSDTSLSFILENIS